MSLRNVTDRLVWTLAALSVALCLSGCVRRRMTIRSNPPGALVFVDRQQIGVTPVSTKFTYYGTRNIELVKDGRETVKEEHRFRAPWYEWPGIDFFTENLWPGEVRDERILDFELPPQQATAPTDVLGRADQLRNEAQRGLVTPTVDPGRPAGGQPFVPQQ